MAKKLIDRIKESLAKEGFNPRTNASRQWIRAKVKELKPTPSTLMRDRERLKSQSFIGRMYFYYYDPKTKDRMPYYDIFPLVIPIKRYFDGFLGLNLHYIHIKNRLSLLDKLSDILTNDNFDEKTRLRISYPHLQASSRIFEATPCIKRYLFNHIESRFLEIAADEWDIAVMLPVQQFVGASTSKVFYDSRKKF